MFKQVRRLLNTERDDVYEIVERLLMETAFEHCEGN
jgi:hypothetical protein